MTSPTTIIQLALIGALVGFAFQRMLDVKDKMIFGWYWIILKNLGKKNHFLYYLTKPLGICIICNTTWIGFIIGAFFTKHWDWRAYVIIAIIGLTSAGIVAIFENIFNYLRRETK